jgi:uncharacterized protein YwgA
MDLQKQALILKMIETLQNHGSRTGKAHIIKGLFLGQAAGLFDLPFDFFLYKHGPYSSDIEATIEEMKTYGAVEVEPSFDGYGVILSPGKMASYPEERAPVPNQILEGINKVCEFLRHRNAKELERMATAAWIRTREEMTDPEEVANRLHELKPHVSPAEARKADAKVQEFLQTVE